MTKVLHLKPKRICALDGKVSFLEPKKNPPLGWQGFASCTLKEFAFRILKKKIRFSDSNVVDYLFHTKFT
jgi:hypothetical protein